MRTQNILTFLFFASCFIDCKQVGYKNSLQELELNGNVKSVRTMGFSVAEEDGKEIIVDTLATDNALILFDEKGNEVERTLYNSAQQTDYLYHSEYDAKGRKTAQQCTDTQGNLMETLTYTYNKDGSREEELLVSHANGNQTKCQNTYDSNGNLIEIDASDKSGKIIYSIYFTYEKNHVVGQRVLIHSIGTQNETAYKNDTQGRELEAVTVFSNTDGTQAQETVTTAYEDDRHGNWLKKRTFLNGKPDKLFLRTIEYY